MNAAAAGLPTRRPPSKFVNRAAAEVFLATLALSLLVLVLGALVVTSIMGRRFDGRLGAIAAEVASRLETDGQIVRGGGGALPSDLGVLGPVIVTVRAGDGAVVDSIPPTQQPLPMDARPDRARFSTVKRAGPGGGSGEEPVRVLTWPAEGGGTVQVGASQQGLRHDQRAVWLALLLMSPVMAVAATVASAIRTRRRMGRLDKIMRLAAEITPSTLHRRLEYAGHQDELARLGAAINSMLAHMEVGFLAQDRFISEVSHELKTPVSVLLLEAQVLERSEPDPLTYAKFVASVEDEMRRLAQLVESFLTLARAKHGDTQVQKVTVDMNDTAVEAGQHCWSYAHMRDLKLSMTLLTEEACPGAPIVSGDPDLLRTMIENLVRNAIAVSARQSDVELSVTSEDHHVTVRVRDHGPGVPEFLASRIFERFVTADHSRQGTKGSGLGLAIAKGIAELHGGQIQFRNMTAQEGGGAEFSARIPLVQDPAVPKPKTE